MEKSKHTHTCRAQSEIAVDGLLFFSKETFAFPQPRSLWESRETAALKDSISQ